MRHEVVTYENIYSSMSIYSEKYLHMKDTCVYVDVYSAAFYKRIKRALLSLAAWRTKLYFLSIRVTGRNIYT